MFWSNFMRFCEIHGLIYRTLWKTKINQILGLSAHIGSVMIAVPENIVTKTHDAKIKTRNKVNIDFMCFFLKHFSPK